MGKGEDGQHLESTGLDARGTTPGAGDSNGCCFSCSRVHKLVTFKCVFVLILGVAVLLSAIFWLPFFGFGDHQDLDLDYAGHDAVASFMLKKSASYLKNYILQLEGEIFDEMRFSSTKVKVISLISAGPNVTKVVFAVESDNTTQSLIRSSFVSLITNQSSLHFAAPLFEDPFSFDVIKFKGGITVIPDQKAFLMQHIQLLFNFTLNFSIDQIMNNFDELTSQLRPGLHLAPYENLYIRLTNHKGSTVAPPTIVQSQVLLAVGIPSKSRIKQLAQTIKGSHKNLGLNNTIFGRVKQVQLSSILQHSLGSDGSSPSPSPSPFPSPTSPPHHHHHHHHRHHHQDPRISPSVSPSPAISISPMPTPVPAPAPAKNKAAEPPDCHFRIPRKHKHSQMAPSTPSVYAPYVAPSQPKKSDNLAPEISPVAAKGPSPKAAYAHMQPPSLCSYAATITGRISCKASRSDATNVAFSISFFCKNRILQYMTLLLLILLGMHF